MTMKLAAIICATALAASPALGAQRAIAPEAEAAALREVARAIPLGSKVKVHTSTGRRLTATLMAADDHAIVIKRHSREPEPAMSVAYTELQRLQRDEGGVSIGKVIGAGLAAGAGAILTIFAIAFSLGD